MNYWYICGEAGDLLILLHQRLSSKDVSFNKWLCDKLYVLWIIYLYVWICFLWAVRSYAEILCTLQLYVALCLTTACCSTKELRVIPVNHILSVLRHFLCVCTPFIFWTLRRQDNLRFCFFVIFVVCGFIFTISVSLKNSLIFSISLNSFSFLLKRQHMGQYMWNTIFVFICIKNL